MTLTATERRVLDLMLAGQQHKEIAASIGLSVRTVKWHAGHIYAKHGVSSREELLRLKQSGGSKLEWDKLLEEEKRVAMLSISTTRREASRVTGFSEAKIGWLLRGIYRILCVKDQVGLAAYAGRHGLLSAAAAPTEIRVARKTA